MPDILAGMSAPADNAVTGLILAGGQGRRMQGRDKGWLTLDGKPLVEHVLERLRPQVQAVAISANRNLDRYRALGVPVWPDTLPDRPGPLAGLLAALERIDTDWLLAVPVDCPVLPADLASRLLAAATSRQANAALASVAGRAEPAFCLVHRRCRSDLADYLARGERRLGAWLARQGAVAVDFTDQPDAFDNLNTPQDLSRFEERLHHANR